jgi:hypothetical protein
MYDDVVNARNEVQSALYRIRVALHAPGAPQEQTPGRELLRAALGLTDSALDVLNVAVREAGRVARPSASAERLPKAAQDGQ